MPTTVRNCSSRCARGGWAKAPPKRRTVGAFTGLCVPVDFPDRPATIARDEIEAFCNQPAYSGFGNRGSVADYFLEASAGRLSYRTVVLPYYTVAIAVRGSAAGDRLAPLRYVRQHSFGSCSLT